MVAQPQRTMTGSAGQEVAPPAPTSIAAVWAWLSEVPDPEIPVVSIVDLGIVRDVGWDDQRPALCVVTVTPTYSGCPATEVIGVQIREALLLRGLHHVELLVQLSPAWTTDWLTERARTNLAAYGIAPPLGRAEPNSVGAAKGLLVLGQDVLALAPPPVPACPRCGSAQTERISQFGSTPCNSLHRCLACREPFDHFKCH